MTLRFSRYSIVLIVILCGALLPLLAFADGYVSLVGIDKLNDVGKWDAQEYINTFYRIAIIIAALIAVLKLIYAGAQYVLSGVVTDKANAKKDIEQALVGLLIIIGAVTILRQINPDIANLPALEPIRVHPSTPNKTSCELDPKSAACCSEKGGFFSKTAAGDTCSIGKTVNIATTGDITTDRLTCISGSGLVWDSINNVCREGGETYRDFPVPPEMEGLDLDNPQDIPSLRLLCARYASDWTYDPDTQSCKKNENFSSGL